MNMNHLTLDTEFDGMDGALLTLALYRDDGAFIYLADASAIRDAKDEWVKANVIPHIEANGMTPEYLTPRGIAARIEAFLNESEAPVVTCDWPSDVIYMSELLITGPGEMINIPGITFQVLRVDSYPNNYRGLVQHHALFDAIALALKMKEIELQKKMAEEGTGLIGQSWRFQVKSPITN